LFCAEQTKKQHVAETARHAFTVSRSTVYGVQMPEYEDRNSVDGKTLDLSRARQSLIEELQAMM
jgi:hypothetical protein